MENKMETQNVTLSIPKDTLRKAKILAVRRGASLSGLLTQALEEIVAQDEAFHHARTRHLQWLANSPDLGTHGDITWTRDDLHER
jgi:hypothetical protein